MYDVPNSRFVCCYSTELGRFGLVEARKDRFMCATCESFSCPHTSVILNLKRTGNLGDDCNLLSFSDDLNRTGDRNNYKPKLLSYKPINYFPTDQLNESLHKLKDIRELESLIPEETACRHCGSNLQDGDPIENNWIAYESCVIVTTTNINFVTGNF